MKRLSLNAQVLGVLGSALALACSDQADPSGVETGGPAPATGGASGGSAGTSAAGIAVIPGESGSSGSAAGGTSSMGGAQGGGTAGGTAGGTTGGASAGMAGGGSSSAGAAGSAGGSASGKPPATPSAGCNMPAGQALGSWVERPKLPVNGKDRQWWVWLPPAYDASKAYPVVFTFHGCGGPDNFIPMQKTAGNDAIIIRGTGGDNGCWSYPGNGDDVKFFDAMLADAEARLCVDTSRVFSTGYSSGAWFTNTLACARGDKLRGAGSVSGGVVGNRGTCSGEFARIFIHDTDDTTNYFDKNGNQAELARIVAQNHCDAATPPVPEDPAPCARYQSCDAGNPVIMCQTMGKKHDRQDTLATTAFWKLFSSL